VLGVKKTGCGNVIAVPILEETLQGELIMMKMTELIGHELRWVQPRAMKAEYELRTGNIIAATLRYRRFSFGTFATAASADGSWTFNLVRIPVSFWDIWHWWLKVTVRASGAETDLAVFKDNTSSWGGKLELPDGRKYLYYTTASGISRRTKCEFTTETDDALISYRKVGEPWFHMSSEVEIHALAKEVPEMPWMVSLGLYLEIWRIRSLGGGYCP
jgi:hypothetical protein